MQMRNNVCVLRYVMEGRRRRRNYKLKIENFAQRSPFFRSSLGVRRSASHDRPDAVTVEAIVEVRVGVGIEEVEQMGTIEVGIAIGR